MWDRPLTKQAHMCMYRVRGRASHAGAATDRHTDHNHYAYLPTFSFLGIVRVSECAIRSVSREETEASGMALGLPGSPPW